MTFFYDDLTDVMHVQFEAKSGPCIHVESPSGSILIIERGTNRLVGISILYFDAKLKEGALSLPELGSVSLPENFLESLRTTRSASHR